MNKEPLLIGALAGVTPLLVNIVNTEADTLVSQFNIEIIMGYVIQAIVLMILGAFLVYVNSEDNKWKAFQIGVMAPALVVGLLNAHKLDGNPPAQATWF
jgi:phosphoglycerol transferase MdoB-like AlkP superfamily enzyme